MTGWRGSIGLLATGTALALLGACSSGQSNNSMGPAGDGVFSNASGNTVVDPDIARTTPTNPAAPSAAIQNAGAANEQTPDVHTNTSSDPVPQTSPALTTATAAADVVRHYYSAIDQGDFRTAFNLWADSGKASKQSFGEFKNGFAHTKSTNVTIGDLGRVEGAAGSSYTGIPVTVVSTLKDGTRQKFTGKYTMRRINDVPGSGASERHWHIQSADLSKAGG